MRLYHRPGSRSTRPLWALEEIGAPYELTVLSREEKRSAEYRERHPLGRVPVLELDDGTFVFESAAICLQLGDLHPASGLVPPVGSSARALVYQWSVFAMAELEPATFTWRKARRAGADEGDLPEGFAAIGSAISGALGDRPWLTGDTFTVADILCTVILDSAFRAELISGPGPLRSYVDRAQARPAKQRADAIDQPAPTP